MLRRLKRLFSATRQRRLCGLDAERLEFKVETLESRKLLAGNVSVSVADGDLVLKGDAEDNSVDVYEHAGTVWVSGDAETSLSGEANSNNFDTRIRIGDLNHLKIKMRGGDDRVSLGYSATHGDTGLTIGNLKAKTGTGDDTVLFRATTLQAPVVKLGAGDDEWLTILPDSDPSNDFDLADPSISYDPRIDVSLTDFVALPSLVTERTFTTVSFTLTNHGPSPVSLGTETVVEYYVSTDTNFDVTEDHMIGETRFVMPMAPGESRVINLTEGLPEKAQKYNMDNVSRLWTEDLVPPGPYYVFAQVSLVNRAPTTSPVELEPIAVNSGPRTITQKELLANATDVAGDSLTAMNLAISEGNGKLIYDGNGTWDYIPELDDDTSVTFSYTITDGINDVEGTATLDITLAEPEPEPDLGFDIELIVTGPDAVKETVKETAENAAAKWERVIIGDLPDVGAVDDILIYIDVQLLDPDVLGQTLPPIFLRPESYLPYLGEITLNSLYIGLLETGVLQDVIEHEIAHALGFGTIPTWDKFLTGKDGPDPRFTGPKATTEYNAIFGNSDFVPVEPVGDIPRPGSDLVHWRESVFAYELMTPDYGPGVFNPLSSITVAAMDDLGYEVDLDEADEFVPPTGTISAVDDTSYLGRL
jgi:hypothetical protein